ncbi:hypothetical protein DVA86_16780 [Streptomyces armeniacus]|uniref:Uncharacterized protein n=1 Tax=Streptomyces armeniacus TaxID=83291 RepID=A0A345XR03_9ACTN|nr:hypothetical protein [Streptomyces armeniacus]AXK34069.1 hypothetical protein DVA86_16780 [Streptomyces armeniacus]
MAARRPPVVVHPPTQSGGRRVTAYGRILGLAYGVTDVYEFLRRAGLPEDALHLDDPEVIEWRGGDETVW